MTIEKPLPPDEKLQKLAGLVNAKLLDSARVNFHRYPNGSTGAVFQCGGHSHLEVFNAALVEDDADLIVRKIKEWMNGVQPANKWTEDQVEADSLDWNA
jgi:hypothetical protein